MGIFDIFRRKRPGAAIPRPPRLPDIKQPDTLERELEAPPAKVPDAPVPAENESGHSEPVRDEARESVAPVLFGPPCIISVDLAANSLVPSPLETFQRGKYIVAADGDAVRLFGILYAPAGATNDSVNQRLKHADMPYFLEFILHVRVGLVLGGGLLDADHGAKSLRAFRGSGTYGLAPEFMVRMALKESNYSVSVNGSELARPEKKAAAAWYSGHGIALEQRGMPYED